RVDGVDEVGVPGIDVHAAVVAALAVGDAAVGGVHLTPRRAAVVGAVQAEVADQEHALRVGIHRHGDRRPAGEPRQTAASYLVPGQTLVDGLEEFGLRRSRLRAPAPPSPSPSAARTSGRAAAGTGHGAHVVPYAG